jgi:transposase
METAMKLRRQILNDGRSIRSVSKETGLSRNTIRKYVRGDGLPSYQRKEPAVLHKLKDYEVQLLQWYETDLTRPKRERRTATKLYEQLVQQGYTGSYYPVCRYLRKVRSTQPGVNQAFIPLQFDPGDAMQFDWSEEVVVLGGLEQRIKVAHFRLAYSRKPYVMAYPKETQEMLLDAFVRAFDFYQGVALRVLIDNPKTMVTRIGKGKEREYHPRFLAMLNHYVMEPVACTPAAGWEKGQIERQVNTIRNQLFKPQLRFDDLASLNVYLLACCQRLGEKPHPQSKDKSIDTLFADEQRALKAVGRPFDGYVEKAVRVSSTCLAQYDTVRYSVPSTYAKQRISLRAYAQRIVLVAGQQVIASHQRSFTKHDYQFEPWHYVPLLKQKPGALRNGAPFKDWALPASVLEIKRRYLKRQGGDRDFVELLLQIQVHGMELVGVACKQSLERKTTQLAPIINLINRLAEPSIEDSLNTDNYPTIEVLPQANCQRYERLLQGVSV